MRKSKSRRSTKSSKSTEREKKIAMHARAKREAEKRRKKGEFDEKIVFIIIIFMVRDMCICCVRGKMIASLLFECCYLLFWILGGE